MELKTMINTILEESDDIIYLSDPDTYEIVYMNKAARRICGLSTEQSVAPEKKCYELFQGQTSPCSFCNTHLLSTDKHYNWEFASAILDKHFLSKAKLVEIDGRLLRMEITTDISSLESQNLSIAKRLTSEDVLVNCIQTLKNGSSFDDALQSILANITEFYQADRSYIYEFDASETMAQCTYESRPTVCGYSLPALESVPLHTLKPLIQLFQYEKLLILTDLVSCDPLVQKSISWLTPNQKQLMLVPFTNEANNILGFIGVDNPTIHLESGGLLTALSCFVVDDLNKRKLVHSLKQMNYVDSLTGLKNRNSYLKRLQELQKSQQALGVVYLDINGLKKANDTHGHTYGDSLISRASVLLTKIFKDDVYRIGGDEFVVLCVNAERNDFYNLVDKLRRRADRDNECKLSIGAKWDDGTSSVGDLIAAADELMYINKQSYYHTSSDTSQKHRAHFVKELISAIDSGNYIVYLQPKVHLENRSIFGAEALIRMKDSDGKLIPPINFIPTLESENAIRYVDFFVLETVCKTLADWRKQGINLISMSVNFSRITLLEADVVDTMLRICRKYKIPPRWITIEVTESIGSMETVALKELIRNIKKAGFSVSLDDFGSQYSNLSLLSNIDFDELKFDKSMVDNIAVNEKSQVIMRYAIDMGLSLNDTISVAEGIETPEQLKLLLQMNCKYGQGYLFSKPIPIEEFRNLIQSA